VCISSVTGRAAQREHYLFYVWSLNNYENPVDCFCCEEQIYDEEVEEEWEGR
jgi:hypothetical protein